MSYNRHGKEERMKKRRQPWACALALALAAAMIMPQSMDAAAAAKKKVKLNMDASERLRILHDFYRQGEEAEFSFDLAAMAKRGHDFKDYICPDSMEKNSDYVKCKRICEITVCG